MPQHVLKSGSDLNDMLPGDLWWGTNFSNAPASGWYMVDCKGDNLFQTAYKYNSNATTPTVYVRSKINEVWQPWSELANMTVEYTTNASNVIDLASGISASAVNFARFGKLAQVYIRWSSSSAISVPAHGNIGNITIGTLKTGRRPLLRTVWTTVGDEAGQAFGDVQSNGTINLGACEGTGTSRTINAGTYFVTGAMYILQ